MLYKYQSTCLANSLSRFLHCTTYWFSFERDEQRYKHWHDPTLHSLWYSRLKCAYKKWNVIGPLLTNWILSISWRSNFRHSVNSFWTINFQFVLKMIKQKHFFYLEVNACQERTYGTKIISTTLQKCGKNFGCYLDYHLKRKSIVHKVLKKDQYKGKVYLQARQLFERFFQNIAMNAPTKQQFDYGHIQYHNILSEILKHIIQIAQSKRTNFWLNLPIRCQISQSHFRKLNKLPIESIAELWTPTGGLEFWKEFWIILVLIAYHLAKYFIIYFPMLQFFLFVF